MNWFPPATESVCALVDSYFESPFLLALCLLLVYKTQLPSGVIKHGKVGNP